MDAETRLLLEWFAGGDTGTSSKTMALWIAGRIPYHYSSTPSDGGDFGRCYRMLEKMGWRNRVAEMSTLNGQWAEFADRWGDIETEYLSEKAGAVGATYKLMKRVEADAFERDGYNVERREDGGLRSATRKDSAKHDFGGMSVSW